MPIPLIGIAIAGAAASAGANLFSSLFSIGQAEKNRQANLAIISDMENIFGSMVLPAMRTERDIKVGTTKGELAMENVDVNSFSGQNVLATEETRLNKEIALREATFRNEMKAQRQNINSNANAQIAQGVFNSINSISGFLGSFTQMGGGSLLGNLGKSASTGAAGLGKSSGNLLNSGLGYQFGSSVNIPNLTIR